MRIVWKGVLILAAVLFAAWPVYGADRAAPYFENTRTVLLLPAAGQSGTAASFLDREMKRIFRYPYYRVISPTERPAGPEAMRADAVSAGADIAVQPVVVRFDQYGRYPMFGDRDPIITTHAELAIYYWEEGMDETARISTRYFNVEIEGMDTRPAYILDRMWSRLKKSFPYRRIPTDRSRNLSGEVTAPGETAGEAEPASGENEAGGEAA